MPKTSTTYRVTGTHETLGHKPGEQFDAYLDPDQEELLVQSGALQRVRLPDHESSATATKKPEQATDTTTREE